MYTQDKYLEVQLQANGELALSSVKCFFFHSVEKEGKRVSPAVLLISMIETEISYRKIFKIYLNIETTKTHKCVLSELNLTFRLPDNKQQLRNT